MASNRTHLTLARIRAMLPPDGKQAIYVFDDDPKQLSVRITPAGAKSFVYCGKLNGTPLRVTIGEVGVWNVDDARNEARRLQTLIDQGKDPREIERAKIEAKAAAKKEIEAAKTYTLERLYESYCAHLEGAGKAGSARSAKVMFNKHVGDELKQLPAKNVTSEDVADMLRAVTEKGKERTAGALRSYLLAAYNIGMRARLDPKLPVAFKEYGVTINPITPIPAISSRTSNRVLTNGELQTYINELGEREADKALALALLSGGQRMEQILRIKVSDWTPETKTLRLFDPKGRRKEARIHMLPLAPRSAAIVEELVAKAEKAKRSELFAATPNAVGKRLQAICEANNLEPTFNLRDVRRTVETRMAGLGISKDTRAQVLSHGLSGVQDKHYDRHSYETEKRNALTAWENWLTAIEKNEQPAPNVVAMERKTVA